MTRQFTLPDLGEGLEEAEIVAWLVNEGDHVIANQPLLSVETDKAVVEIPSPWSGTITLQAIAAACQAEPSLNAWYNSEVGERRLLSRVDVGIAVDLEGGLIVPVLRNVGERDSSDLRAGLDRMRADAAARAIPPEELRGATITLSNFGMIGGRFASLVVVPPQVAIIGAGRAEQRVVVDRGQQVIHRMLPLSLTFDHRVVTGGEAARFLAAVKSALAQS